MAPHALTSANLLAHQRSTNPNTSKMKVLIAGGSSQLAQSTLIPALLQSPYIKGLVLLVRTALPASTPFLADRSRVTQIVHPDFSTFGPEFFTLLRDTHNVRAVAWCVGGPASRFKTVEEAQKANVALPVGFLESCVEFGLVPTPSGLSSTVDGATTTTAKVAPSSTGGRYAAPGRKQPFRFIYFSALGAEQEQFRSLWSNAAFRKMKGAAERALLGLAEEKGQGMLEVYCLRLGSVLKGGQSVGNVLWESVGTYISEELVAKKVVALCVDGRGKAMYGEKEGSGVLEHKEILGEGWANISNTVPR